MSRSRKEATVGVSYRVPERIRDWLNTESAEQERSANWLVTQILTQAYEESKSRHQQGAEA
ncbi:MULTISPECIES: hypothetical protein [Delftia]|uniref:hypothetical protein n=1 Tax=Delftia TaxID=80865 RepID=UPI000F82FCB5|nr:MULTISPECIES: hypothetical protein [Delftia]KAA9181990.1 hypothetical protein F3K36_00105 [Delftia sp. BR1]WEL96961.1 hypothetical protein PW274_23235 [Delftia tsuruhatensis]WQM84903.1 hypothetical protein RNT40_08630 [Delftia tsuruhatensis]